ncbi:MAG: M20/M25/M40 family metallo-hydrolase [Actinomycetota bacterium]|nr:M20/M25/M40 family metallo-hydrolase [Actinomycetota bacterium]
MPERAQLESRTVDLLRKLIATNTVNPPGNEEAVQLQLRELLENAGLECELLSSVEGRPNLVARLRGRSDGPTLAYLGHCDTVLADPDDWTVDPWSGELRDGWVWGRGAVDMKGQVAAEATAVAMLAEEGWRPESGELLLIVTADEEAGAAHGARWLCENHPDRVRCDYVVNEGGGHSFEFEGRRIYAVEVAEKGTFRFTLTMNGHAGHASIPKIADNALTKMAPILQALAERRAELDPSPEPVALMEALGIDHHDLERGLAEASERDPRMALLLEPTLSVTFAPTMIRASDKINVIPGRAHLRVDCRVPPGLGADHARARLEGVLGENGYEVRFDEEVVGNRSPIESPLMERIEAFVEREDPGATVAPVMLPGFTDSHWFRKAFPDCVAYGFCPHREIDLFTAAALMHSADERVPVADLGMAAAFFAELAPEMLG